jgi:hypothetical protein
MRPRHTRMTVAGVGCDRAVVHAAFYFGHHDYYLPYAWPRIWVRVRLTSNVCMQCSTSSLFLHPFAARYSHGTVGRSLGTMPISARSRNMVMNKRR